MPGGRHGNLLPRRDSANGLIRCRPSAFGYLVTRDRLAADSPFGVKNRQRGAAEEALAATLGRHPTQRELADELGVSTDDLAVAEGDVHRSVVLSLQGFSDAGTLEGMLPDQDPSPEQVMLNRERNA